MCFHIRKPFNVTLFNVGLFHIGFATFRYYPKIYNVWKIYNILQQTIMASATSNLFKTRVDPDPLPSMYYFSYSNVSTRRAVLLSIWRVTFPNVHHLMNLNVNNILSSISFWEPITSRLKLRCEAHVWRVNYWEWYPDWLVSGWFCWPPSFLFGIWWNGTTSIFWPSCGSPGSSHACPGGCFVGSSRGIQSGSH